MSNIDGIRRKQEFEVFHFLFFFLLKTNHIISNCGICQIDLFLNINSVPDLACLDPDIYPTSLYNLIAIMNNMVAIINNITYILGF